MPAIIQTPSNLIDRHKFFSNDKTTIIGSAELYLLAVLNSKITDFYMHLVASTKQGGYLEYKPVYLSQIPIASSDIKSKSPIESLVTQILAAKKENPAADTTALEAETDRLVYGLYGLTEEEIAIVEGLS